MFPREDFHDNHRCFCFSKSAETTFVCQLPPRSRPNFLFSKTAQRISSLHSANIKITWYVWKHKYPRWENDISLECGVKNLVREKQKKRKHEYRWNTRKFLPSRLPGCVRYAKNKKNVSVESGNISFMLANKTFFFSQWTHNLFVLRKRAKWKVSSHWPFYDAGRAEHFGSFPAFYPRCQSVCSLFLKSFCFSHLNRTCS